MKMLVNVQTRLALIDEWRWELIHGEDANPLHILLYLLVKQNDIIVNGFDHRHVTGHDLYIANEVRNYFSHRPIRLPLGILEVSNARIQCSFLVFDVVEQDHREPLPTTFTADSLIDLEGIACLKRNLVPLRSVFAVR